MGTWNITQPMNGNMVLVDVHQLLDNRITKLQNQNERQFKSFKKIIWKNKAKDRRKR